eukprot:6411126-Prymnesium_polylepis.1
MATAHSFTQRVLNLRERGFPQHPQPRTRASLTEAYPYGYALSGFIPTEITPFSANRKGMSNEGLRGALEGCTARVAAASIPGRKAHGDRPSLCASQVAARPSCST